MQRIMEPIFEIPYLILVITLGIIMICKSNKRKDVMLFGIAAVVLGVGDAFHLIPRMYALIESGNTSLEKYAFYLGYGKLATSITMTAFYVILYHVWMVKYQKSDTFILTILTYVLAVARVVLCLLPQNEWASINASVLFAIVRNVPFVILGTIIVFLFLKERTNSLAPKLKYMYIAIILSFTFYIPVVLFASEIPVIGFLMIPKTIAYVWIVISGYQNSKISLN